MIGVYLITHIASGKVYVGSSIDVERRLKTHLSALRNQRHRNKHLQRAWCKYGESAFRLSVVEEASAEELLVVEQLWINATNATHECCGYNACLVAGSVGSLPKSEEHRKKIGAAHLGAKRSEEARQRMSAAMRGVRRGPLPASVKAKLSAAKKGRPMSAEAKQKLSEARRGKPTGPCSDQRRAAISAAKRARDAARIGS